MKKIVLPAIDDPIHIMDELDRKLRRYFYEHLYSPIAKELGINKKSLKNELYESLSQAIASGKIEYHQGRLYGKFNSKLSKEIKALGGQFDNKSKTWKIPFGNLPPSIRHSIFVARTEVLQKTQRVVSHLDKVDAKAVSEKFKCEPQFVKMLSKVDTDFRANVRNISVQPKLSDSDKKRISDEWQTNMNLYVQKFTEEQIVEMRSELQEKVLSGERSGSYRSSAVEIQKIIGGSYESAEKKAKFLARQESRLLLAKFKEVRYADAGITEYVWETVNRPHDANPKMHKKGNVRYSHWLLDGKTFKFTEPPVTSEPGQPVRHNNPGQDYNCRCRSRAVVKF